MRFTILVAVTLFGLVGSWLGGMLDHGNMFGVWGILLGTVGSFVGVWAGYKAGQYFGF